MAVLSRAVTVTTSATRLDSESKTDQYHGSAVVIYNNGTATIFLGGADVTTANGVPVPVGTWGPGIDLQPEEAVYGIVAAATQEARVVEAGV